VRPLLPGDHPTEPLVDSGPLLDSPAALQERAAQDGYLACRDLVPLSLVASVRAEVRDDFERHGWVEAGPGNPPRLRARPGARLSGRGFDDPDWIALQQRLTRSHAMRDLVECEPILSVLEVLLGEPAAVATANHCWLKLPGSPEQTTRPHQDSYYLPDCPRLWTVWLPLVHTPLDVGPIGVVPGSHRQGDWPHVDALTGIDVPRDVCWATSELSPGAAVFFEARTVHCAWSNVSDTWARLSLDVRYEPRDAPGPTPLRPMWLHLR